MSLSRLMRSPDLSAISDARRLRRELLLQLSEILSRACTV